MINTQLQSRQRSVPSSISAVASALLVIVGGLVLAGWIFDFPALKSVSPAWVSMKVNTAVCFVLSGLSLWCLRDEHSSQRVRRLGHACAALVTLVSLVTLGEYLVAEDFGIDRLLMLQPAAAADPAVPGRMSAATASGFLLTALALFGLDWKNRRGQRPLLAFALLTAVIGLLAIAGYIYGVKSLHAFLPFSFVAVHTAALLIVASVGILCARPDHGPLGILTADGVGSEMARRILPLAIVLPLLIGWLRMQGERQGFYGFEFGLALFASANVILFAALIWITAISLNRGDAERKRTAASTALLSAIVESSDDAIIGKDLNGIVTSWNTGAARIFGYAANEILGRSILLLIPRDRQEEEEEILKRLRRGERIDHFETVRMGKEGRSIEVSVTVSAINDGAGKIVGASKVARDITERKRAEEGLLRFRMAMDSSLDGIFLMDFETFRYLDVNETGCRMLGYSREELLTMRTMDTNLSLTEADQRRRFQEAKSLGSDHVMAEPEGRYMRRRDGTTFPIEVARRYLRVGNKEIVVGIARDISERKQAEEALRASEVQLRSFIEQAPASIAMFDVNMICLAASRRWVSAYGRGHDDLVGLSHYEVHPDMPQEWREIHRRGLAGEAQKRDEDLWIQADGTRNWLRWAVQPWRDVHGVLGGIMILAEDITQGKQIEEEIRETKNFLASIFDNIPNSIFIKDARDLRFVRVNPACEKLTGYPEKEFLGKSDYDFFPKEQADFFVAKDRETLASSQQVFVVEETITSRDGTQKLLQTKKFSIPDKDGQPQYLLGMSEDITERRLAEQQIRESEAKYRQLIEQASDGIFISDAEGNFLIANSRSCELLGYSEGELIGLNGKVTYLEEERAIHSGRMDAVAAGQVLRFERMVRRKDGSAFPAEVSIKMLDNGMVQVIFHDITQRRSQEQKIARLSRIQAVLSGINSAIVRIHDQQALFDEACRIATEHGAFPVAIIGITGPDSRLEHVASGGAGADLLSALPTSARGGPAGVAMRAINEQSIVIDNDIVANPNTDLIRKAAIARGCRSAIGLPLFRDKAIAGVFLLYGSEKGFFDEEEVKLLNELAGDVSFALTFIAQREKVDYLAYYDALTGLPNRSLFFDRLGHQLATAKRERTGMALVLIDLDRFRLVNDTLGRQAGDALLEAVAKRIEDSIRGLDSVARVGANRFAFAVSGISNSGEAAHALEARNNVLFGQPFVLGHEELRVQATAGVAMFPGDGNDPESLFANAEAALRKAKAESLRFLFYSPEMNARVADSLRLENKLRRALENDELVLWYQPKVDVKTRKLAGFEALMRWQDPETGMVPPAKFIPLMEQTGLILEAGRWALLQVARDCRLWVTNGIKPPRIAVNVSPIQLRQKNFVATIVEAAEKAEEAGALLDLEITESVIMENVETIIPILQTVRGLGVEIAVDDFGTGYSSLAYIARLPIQALKVDRSFVVGMTQSQDSLAIVRSVISLAHALRLHVIAEGVETEEQAALLLQLDCDQMQGYLFSRPVPPGEVPALVRKLTQD